MGKCYGTRRPEIAHIWEERCFPQQSAENSVIDMDFEFDISEADSIHPGGRCSAEINSRISKAFAAGRSSTGFKIEAFAIVNEAFLHAIHAHAGVDPESISITQATKIIQNQDIRKSVHFHVLPSIRESLDIRREYGVYVCSSYKEYHENRDNLIEPYEVHLQRPDPSWKLMAEKIKMMLVGMDCSQQWKFLEHIGSTAIPDLIAKPIVDLMIVLKKDYDFMDCFEQFLQQQWELKNELPLKIAFASKAPCSNDDWGFFQVPHNAAKKCRMCEVNIHIFVEGTKNAIEKLLFRDYLTSSEGSFLKAEYTKIKQNLMDRLANNDLSVSQYASSKTEIVSRILSAAKEWDQRQDNHPESGTEFSQEQRRTRIKTNPVVNLIPIDRSCKKHETFDASRIRITRSLKMTPSKSLGCNYIKEDDMSFKCDDVVFHKSESYVIFD